MTISKILSSGQGLEKFKEFIKAQGGDERQADNPELLPQATIRHIVTSPKSGYIKSVLAEPIGNAAMLLGAGRMTKEDAVDLSAGVILHKKRGNRISRGEGIATLLTNDIKKLDIAEERLLNAFTFSSNKPRKSPLILGKVS